MHEPIIRSGDHILVGDEKKALLFENCGNALSPRFEMVQQLYRDEHRGVADIIAALQKKRSKGQMGRLHIVAPPRALGSLREAMPRALKQCVVSETDKDLTGHPVRDIEKNLRQAS